MQVIYTYIYIYIYIYIYGVRLCTEGQGNFYLTIGFTETFLVRGFKS